MNNSKLGIRAIHQKTLTAAILEAKNNGFEILEVHLSSPQFLPQTYTASELKKIKAFAFENGVLLQVHDGIGHSLIEADEILRKAEKARLKRLIGLSQQLGARCLTLHPGKAPSYYLGQDEKVLLNDNIYPEFYSELFDDSLRYLASLAPKDLYICVENTDNFNFRYQKILQKYLKTGKLFLTWDLYKTLSFGTTIKVKSDQMHFFQRNIRFVRNIHISGKGHGSIKGHEKHYSKFVEFLKEKDLPFIIETMRLNQAIEIKKYIKSI